MHRRRRWSCCTSAVVGWTFTSAPCGLPDPARSQRPSDEGGAKLRHDERRAVDACGLAEAGRLHARRHGEHRRLLESGLDPVGGSVHPVVGQCPARQGIRLHRPTPRRITPHSIDRMTDFSTRSLINRNHLPAAEFSRRGPGSCHTGCGAVPIQSRTKLRSSFASSFATFAIIANFNPALEYLTLIHRQVSHS